MSRRAGFRALRSIKRAEKRRNPRNSDFGVFFFPIWVRGQTGAPQRASGGGAAGVSSPLQFNPTSTNPIAISFLQLGPISAIPIPNWDPYRNINSPIGAPTSMTGPCNRKCPFYWAFSITSTQLNVVWLNWAIASIQLLQCNWLNASIPGSGQPGQLPCDGHVVILYTGPTSSRR